MSKAFFGGMPTKPDVDKLMHLDLSEGDTVTHEQIEDIIGHPHDSNRYRAIVGRWRRVILAQQNLLLLSLPNVGYKVLTPSERVASGVDGFVKAGKRIRKNTILLGMIPDQNLSTVERTKRDHVTRVSLAVLETMQEGAKQVELKKIDPLPRRAI